MFLVNLFFAIYTAKYYFTSKSKYFSYKELSDLLVAFGIPTDTDSMFDDLKNIIDTKMYLMKTKDLDFKYDILIDYKEEE